MSLPHRLSSVRRLFALAWGFERNRDISSVDRDYGSARSPGVSACLAARTPSTGGGGPGLSRFQDRTAQVKCRCPGALIANTMSVIAMLRQLARLPSSWRLGLLPV